MNWFVETWWKTVSKGFDWLYNELAFTYDGVSWFVSLGEWRQWQLSVLPFLPPTEKGTILELAHGTGHVQSALLRAGYRTVGLDISSAMGRITARRLQDQHLPTCLVRASAFQLPFASASFHAIVCTFPTSFIFSHHVFAELNRVLQNAGCVVLVLGAELHKTSLLANFLEWLYRITGQRSSTDTDIWDAINQLCESVGLVANMHPITLKRSTVTVLVLCKQ